MARPMLDNLELQQVQNINVEENQSLIQHQIPALEGDFLQLLGRRATRIALTGVFTGSEAGENLSTLREKFRTAEPIPFVADITTATQVDRVLIEDLMVRELAGKPERYAYALNLCEYIAAPESEEEPPEPEEPDEPSVETGILEVTVIVEDRPGFDYSTVTVTVEGTQEDGTDLNRTLNDRSDNVWTEEMPPGDYTVRAVVTEPEEMSGSASATVRAGETERVTITLRAGQIIAKAFLVHFWFDKAFIEPCMRAVMRQVAKYAQEHPDEKLLIVGHTDMVGDLPPVEPLYNQSLSERRARSAYAFLTFGRDRAAALAEWNQLRQQRPTGERRTLKDTWGTREYQYILQNLGYYVGNIDEQHGPRTDEAVQNFQTDQGLSATGAVDDATWEKLIELYLSQDNLSVPESQFFPNCEGEILKWLGCGEQDPVRNTQDAWRPNRRTEFLFVQAERIPCEVPRPDTFDLPEPGAVGSDWCLGPGNSNRRCEFTTRDPEEQEEDHWLIQPAEPERVVVNGAITYEDDTPLANAQYVLIAPDGEYLHTDENGEAVVPGERPRGSERGRPIPNRADENGRFRYPRATPVGIYILELPRLEDPQVARLRDSPPQSARGNIICQRVDEESPTPTPEREEEPILATAEPTVGSTKEVRAKNAVVIIPTPIIRMNPPIVIVLKDPPYFTRSRRRRPIQLCINTRSIPGTGGRARLTRSGGPRIRLFDRPTDGTEINVSGGHDFTGAALDALCGNGITLYAESLEPSNAVGDYELTLTLTLSGGIIVGAPATIGITAVELTLDICLPRPASGGAPPVMAPPEQKMNPGRLLPIQILPPGTPVAANRAMLIVRQPQPSAIVNQPGVQLILTPDNDRVQLFEGENPSVHNTNLATPTVPYEVPATALAASDVRLWIEGRNVSSGERDTGFQLGIRNLEPDGDRVAVTVIPYVEVTEIDFQSGIDIYDATSTPVSVIPASGPEWRLSPSRNFPATYIRTGGATTPARSLRINATTRGSNFSGIMTLKAEGPPGSNVEIGPVNVTFSGGTANNVSMQFIILPSTVKRLQNINLQWKYQHSSWPDFANGNSTSHTLYILDAQPLAGVIAYTELLDYSCHWADGQTGTANVFNRIWNQMVAQATGWTYYGPGREAQTTRGLIVTNNGDCDAWAHFMADCCRIHGIDARHFRIMPSLSYNGIVVNNVNYGTEYDSGPPRKTFARHHPHEIPPIIGLDTSPSGLRGQNVSTPDRKIFNWHAVVIYGGTYYDPSYMVQWTSESEFRDALAGQLEPRRRVEWPAGSGSFVITILIVEPPY